MECVELARQLELSETHRQPLTWPVWNQEHRRLVRFWSAAGDLDVAVIDALRSRRFDRVTVVEPSTDELAAQLQEELAVARATSGMLDTYWDRDWRRHHSAHEDRPRITCGGQQQR